MIESKKDFLYYLECDRIALGIDRKKPRFLRDDIWKYEIALRKAEYLKNCPPILTFKRFLYKLHLFIAIQRYYSLGRKLGIEIPLNVFGPGLAIVHAGTIVVAGGAKVGANCRIHEGVTIGATNGSNRAATIGDNVFISTGAKIIGEITISDNVAIAANAVVVKDIITPVGVTVGGVPAKVISKNTSRLNLNPATERVNKMVFYR